MLKENTIYEISKVKNDFAVYEFYISGDYIYFNKALEDRLSISGGMFRYISCPITNHILDICGEAAMFSKKENRITIAITAKQCLRFYKIQVVNALGEKVNVWRKTPTQN